VLVQPATVDRWHREGLRRCWRRRSRSPGRPRIDSTCRDLIRRLAAENHLWGASRIHGELLKLGIAVSERTVSRYLQGRPTARSQTWRTFFANHLGDMAFMSPLMLLLLKTPFSLRSLMLRLWTDRLLIDVVRGHFVAPDPALVGPLSGHAAPRDPRLATPVTCSRAVTFSASASDASGSSALGVVVTRVA
jgi:Homeodomain-like domain